MKRFLCAGVVVVLTAAPAHAIDHSKGTPGYCTSATGVTVVVDFQQLGGTTIVRCFPQATRGTGLDALKGAGFQIAGAQRWGEGFVCRIENRPSATEELPVTGKPGYQERCVDTPPAAAYWSYWHAGNNCPWEYSQWGVKNRDVTPGGFEGWSFSLNASADSNPEPRIAAVRPGTGGTPCDATEAPKPKSPDVDEKQPVQGRQPPTTQPKPDGPASEALPPPKPRPKAKDPSGDVAFTGGEQAANVNDVIKEQSGASSYAPWAAGAAVVLLAGAALLAARRRKQRS